MCHWRAPQKVGTMRGMMRVLTAAPILLAALLV
jgi:hypothetical protein